MPIYEYYCKDCGKEFEELQKISASPLTECKFCSGKVEKLVSNSSFTFKGGGWYITDYKNKNKNKKSNSSSKNSKIKNTGNQKKTKNNTDKKSVEKPISDQRKVS